jgi:hypothetical protein
MRETGTRQQVAQLHERYMMINTDSQIKIIGRNMRYPNSANKMKKY